MKQPRHIESNLMQVRIAHEDISNLAGHTTGTTWNCRTVKFVWNVTRPEAGEETITRFCPDCGAWLQIKVSSREKIISGLPRMRAIGVAGVIGCLAFGLGLYYSLQPTFIIGLAFLCIFGFMFSLMAIAIGIMSLGNEWGLNATGGSLTHGLLNEKAAGPYNQHYIEKIESL